MKGLRFAKVLRRRWRKLFGQLQTFVFMAGQAGCGRGRRGGPVTGPRW